MKTLRSFQLAVATLVSIAVTAVHAKAADSFVDCFRPFAEKFCVRCHNREMARGELDLTRYTEARHVSADFRRWNHVIEFVRDGEMPPENEPQPTIEERRVATETLEAILLEEAQKHAGDPGVVSPRRLSNTEYDRSVRDLTGVDIRPTRDFPPDPAGGEGFDNTGEALGISPSLLKKYLAAAQQVSEHMVLKTGGIAFAPFPVTSYNEQKKLTEQAIIDFYQKHVVRVVNYLEACWRYRHRDEVDRALGIDAWAEHRELKQRGLSPRYLTLAWETLSKAPESSGYLKQVGQLWEAIPAPTGANFRPPELSALERFIEFCQRRLCHREPALIQANAGNWPISHLDFRTRTAAQRDQFDPSNIKNRVMIRFDRLKATPDNAASAENLTLYLRFDRAFGDDGESGDREGGMVVLHRPIFSKANEILRNDDEAKKHETVTLREVLEQHAPSIAQPLAFGKDANGAEIDADSCIVRAPAMVEIPLSAEMLRQLDGKQLFVECELREQSENCGVYVQPGFGKPPEDRYAANVELLIDPNGNLAKSMADSSSQFCRAFPNRFFFVDNERGLAAGFHLVDGFFRDDRPLMEKVLSEQEKRELDGLWRELDFVTQSTETLIRGFVWFERSERHVLHDQRFDFLRPEDPRLVEDDLLTQFEKVYLEKMGVKLIDGKLEPEKPLEKPNAQFELIHGFFAKIRAGLALYREQLKAAEQLALADLEALAERAFRRPLVAGDIKPLRALYETLRKRGQSVEASLRGVFAAVLMSPDFFFHLSTSAPGPDVRPLDDDALASRLSYFLWSTLPDDELRAAARMHKLQDEVELVAQTRRMLAVPRIDAFAREFFGQWLRYRDYLSKDPINAPAFAGYDDPLREAMFEEPVRLTTHLIQQDRPITELIDCDETFVNGVLAEHYGREIARQYGGVSANPADWHKVSGLRELGRGGLLGMGVILTKTSKGERTSPIKRGFWAVHHLLGQHFPPPPVDVPELPSSEKQVATSIRELIASHTANAKCAMCHTHFDSLGIALEGFDPIGRARTNDLAGRPIDNVVVLPNGQTAQGISGLIEYIREHRRRDFVDTLCRKFLGYALGRSVLLSDQPLLIEMEAALQRNDDHFSALFETVVRSPQFRTRRGSELEAGEQ
jgi:hypothetical protein